MQVGSRRNISPWSGVRIYLSRKSFQKLNTSQEMQTLSIQPKTEKQNRALSRKRILIENIIRRLKIFRMLSERYRS